MNAKLSRITNLTTGLVFFLVLVLGVVNPGSVSATGPDWLDAAHTPTLVKEWSYPAGNYNTVLTDNSGCSNVTFKTSSTTSTTQCLVKVQSGNIGNGYYLPNGATIGSTVNKSNFTGIPSTDQAYYQSTTGQLIIYPGIFKYVQPNVGTGNQSYTVGVNNSSFILADKSGAQFSIDANTISTSDNGQWMVVYDSSASSFVSVNLQTLDIIPFAGPTPNVSSTSTAISNDGRYVAIHSPNSGGTPVFKVYDLSTCATPPSHITTFVSCSSRDMQSYVTSAVPGYVNFQRIRFNTDYLMTIKAYGTQGTASTIDQYDIEMW